MVIPGLEDFRGNYVPIKWAVANSPVGKETTKGGRGDVLLKRPPDKKL